MVALRLAPELRKPCGGMAKEDTTLPSLAAAPRRSWAPLPGGPVVGLAPRCRGDPESASVEPLSGITWSATGPVTNPSPSAAGRAATAATFRGSTMTHSGVGEVFSRAGVRTYIDETLWMDEKLWKGQRCAAKRRRTGVCSGSPEKNPGTSSRIS